MGPVEDVACQGTRFELPVDLQGGLILVVVVTDVVELGLNAHDICLLLVDGDGGS